MSSSRSVSCVTVDAMTGSDPQNDVDGMGREAVPPKKKNVPPARSNVQTKKKKKKKSELFHM